MCKAIVIEDSRYRKNRITTMEVFYPRFILPEINTHRIISRSTASSRAIPVAKMLQSIEDNPFIPETFGMNKPGMQASEETAGYDKCKAVWLRARNDAVEAATDLMEAGVHKQLANRLLEPFSWTRTVMTSTTRGWENFFTLRNTDMVQPEMKKLAGIMLEAYKGSTPKELQDGEWHLPYVTEEGNIEDLKLISAARCARVSYRLHNGLKPDLLKDKALAYRLLDDYHLSPFDHPAMAELNTDVDTRQYDGFVPYRSHIE